MSLWHWVRHGPTHQKTFVGWRNVPADLSDLDTIDRVAAHLPADAIVVSSDLLRSVATADAIMQDRRRLPHDPHLREFHFGSWDGRHFSDIADRHGPLSRAYWEDPGHTAPPGGESWNAAAHRVQRAVHRIEAAHPGRQIIAVAHIGVILTQVQTVLGQTPNETIAQKIDNLSVTTLDTDARKVLTINHLP